MPRIRYLKPEFFSDEQLAELKFEARLTFAGLWCYADKAGRLEDRPKFLKAMIFPYDNVDIEKQLQCLSSKPFITRYEVGGRRLIEIVNWDKHQKPHHTEADSKLPPPPPKEEKESSKEKEEINKGMGMGMGKQDDPSAPTKNGDLTVNSTLINALVSSFNHSCTNLPKIQELSRQRKEKIKARLKNHDDLNWWLEVFRKANAILIPGKNGHGDWTPTFDWLIKNDENPMKVMEGNYSTREKQPGLKAWADEIMEEENGGKGQKAIPDSHGDAGDGIQGGDPKGKSEALL